MNSGTPRSRRSHLSRQPARGSPANLPCSEAPAVYRGSTGTRPHTHPRNEGRPTLPDQRTISSSLKVRFQGKQRRLLLGEYPSLTLAEARKRARKAHSAIDGGRDVVAERQAAKAARTDTVATPADDYLRKHALKFKRSAAEDKRILDVEVLPRWSEKSVRELSRRDVRALVERVTARAPIMANRVLAVVRKMLNFAVDHDWIDANPAARVAKPAPERSRDRVLNEAEIRRVWRVLTHLPSREDRPAAGRKRAKGTKDDPLCPISAPLAALLNVRLLTAQRGGEVVRMRWS